MENVDQKLGARIAEHRTAIRLTQAELAERVGVQPETISRIETGHRAASIARAAQIAEALHLELHELFRLQSPTDPKAVALERFVRFASRLTQAEIEGLLDINARIIDLSRHAAPA
jgi:DNA-binding XRE family transcriptional regulator